MVIGVRDSLKILEYWTKSSMHRVDMFLKIHQTNLSIITYIYL